MSSCVLPVLVGVLCVALAPVAGAAPAPPEKKAPPATQPSKDEIAALIDQMGGGTMGDRVRASGVVKKLVQIGQPAVPQLLDAAAHHKDPWVRLWCLGALGDLGEPRAIPILIAATRSDHFHLRLVATGQLDRFVGRDPAVAPCLAERMGDPTKDVRDWAAKGLGRAKITPEIRDALRGNLANSDADVRADNFAFLVRLDHAKPADAIAQTLAEGKDANERSAAAGALLRFPPGPDEVDRYVGLFVGALADPSPLVQREGVRGLQWILKEGDKAPPPEIQQRILAAIDEKLPAMVDSSHDLLRGDALYLLSLRRREKIAPTALKLMKDPSAYVREKAIRALANALAKARIAFSRT